MSTDSRAIENGNLFIALRGEKFDGHAFIEAALKAGAAGVVVDEQGFNEYCSKLTVPTLVVRDTTKYFQQLARLYRQKFSLPIVAVAGSNGKTTTKDMIAAVLKKRYSVLKTEGNFNNHIGVPQTLFRLNRSHDIAIVEMGTNHSGELETLAEIVNPTHAVITSIGREHLEFFHDLDGVAAEEGAVFSGGNLTKNRFGFVNIDDYRIRAQASKLSRKLKYGFNSSCADVCGKIIETDSRGCAVFQFTTRRMVQPLTVRLQAPGIHNAANGLTAAAIGISFGIPKKLVVQALEEFSASSKRTEIIQAGKATILNDTYNSNPDSVIAALKTMYSIATSGKKIIALGDMLELGSHAEHEHAKIGVEVADLGFEFLFTYGPLSQFTYEASKLAFSKHFKNKTELIDELCSIVEPGDAVLIKGSRGMKMEEVTTKLVEYLKQR